MEYEERVIQTGFVPEHPAPFRLFREPGDEVALFMCVLGLSGIVFMVWQVFR